VENLCIFRRNNLNLIPRLFRSPFLVHRVKLIPGLKTSSVIVIGNILIADPLRCFLRRDLCYNMMCSMPCVVFGFGFFYSVLLGSVSNCSNSYYLWTSLKLFFSSPHWRHFHLSWHDAQSRGRGRDTVVIKNNAALMQFHGMKLRHAAKVICGVVGHQNLVIMLRLEVSLVQGLQKVFCCCGVLCIELLNSCSIVSMYCTMYR